MMFFLFSLLLNGTHAFEARQFSHGVHSSVEAHRNLTDISLSKKSNTPPCQDCKDSDPLHACCQHISYIASSSQFFYIASEEDDLFSSEISLVSDPHLKELLQPPKS